jgi:hypothetical protein
LALNQPGFADELERLGAWTILSDLLNQTQPPCIYAVRNFRQ